MRRAVAGLLALLCAGCGTSSGPSAGAPAATSSAALRTSGTPAPPVPGLAAEAVQLRTDAAVGGQFQVRVTRTGEEPVTVTAVALDSPGFAPLPATAETAELVAGRVVDLPTPYGEPVCEVAAEPAAARLTVVRPDGTAEELRVPLAAEVLAEIHARECAARVVTAVATVSVTDLTLDGETVTGRLRLVRAGADDRPVVLTRLQGNVLYTAEAQLPLELPPDAEEAATDLVFGTARCDPHALAEAKQPYLFALAAVLDGGAETILRLPLDESEQRVLHALTVTVCVPA